ncbi:MAG: hypothetical protein OXK76_01650 [Gammaproteobacteria bacterium]|nr:hypothetical protein [Gammaproteobacteria bacterium]
MVENRRQAAAVVLRTASRALALVVALGTVFLGGCKGGASITVDTTVPRPLVDPIPAAMGVYIDETLKTYVHEEELPEYGDYRIDIGASQTPVFARVFDAMFEDVVYVQRAEDPADSRSDQTVAPDADDEEGEDEPDTPIRFIGNDGSSLAVDGIIAPSIEVVQFAIPDQTGGDFYEVWIRYKLTLFDAGGNALGEWPLRGYGKANERNFGQLGKQTPALHEATTWALRDAAAVLAVQFRDQAEVQDWLATIGAGENDEGAPQ